MASDPKRTLDPQAMERLAAFPRMSGSGATVTGLMIVSRGTKGVTDAARRKLGC
jgi:4-diphosphocytidyl-2C-methyl-D-erythritol kinase